MKKRKALVQNFESLVKSRKDLCGGIPNFIDAQKEATTRKIYEIPTLSDQVAQDKYGVSALLSNSKFVVWPKATS